MSPAVGLDPRQSADAELFRKRVRQFLDDHLPAGWTGIGAITDRAEADRFVELARHPRRQRAPRRLVAGGVRRRRVGAGLEQVVLVEELARAGVPAMGYNDTFSIKMLGGTAAAVGNRGAEATVPAADPVRRGPLVPGLLRTGLGFGPRVTVDPWPCSTATTGSSTGRRCGRRGPAKRTGSSCSPGPTRVGANTPASRSCSSTSSSPASTSDRSTLSGESEFNEVFFTAATTPATTSSARSTTAGRSPTPCSAGARRGGGDQPDPVPGRARPPRRADPRPGPQRRPGHPPAPGRRPYAVRDHALARIPHPHRRAERRRDRRARGVDRRSSTGASTTGVVTSSPSTILGRRWRCSSTGRGPRHAYRTDDPGAPNTPARGWARSTTRRPARSTPERQRCSATSSASMCSAYRASSAVKPGRSPAAFTLTRP